MKRFAWYIEDYSMACLVDENSEYKEMSPVLTVSPCESCLKHARAKQEKPEWEWGRCCTPSKEDADFILLALNSFETQSALIAKLELALNHVKSCLNNGADTLTARKHLSIQIIDTAISQTTCSASGKN